MKTSVRYILLTLVFLCMTIGVFADTSLLTAEPGKLALYFLDLEVSPTAEDKSGDATILISPEGKVMLLDCGHPESAPQVIDALTKLGVKRINYFVASHPHIDHIGSFPVVAAKFPIDRVYRTKLEYPTDIYKAFVQTIDQYHIPVTYLEEGDSFSFGSSITIKIFNPSQTITYPKNYPDNSTQFVNNASLAMRFSYGLSSVWFSGDLYIAQERTLVNKYGTTLQSDVIKANHHGADTSNSLRWIKNMRAKIVVAMQDQFDSINVYNTYKKYGAEYHLTLNDGLVKVVMDDKQHYQVFDTKDSWMN